MIGLLILILIDGWARNKVDKHGKIM
jgi:hypothetical protein